MVFKNIELSDWERIATYCKKRDSRQLNYCFEVLFLWRDVCDFEVAEQDGFLYLKTYLYHRHNFLFPLGDGNLEKALQTMAEYESENGCEFQLYQVNPEQKKYIMDHFPDKYEFEPIRNEFEYLFEVSKLTDLKGKKLQPKRNHINFFEKNNDWTFEEISEENLLELMVFSYRWDMQMQIPVGSPLNMENLALMNAFESYSCLDLQGLILRVGDQIVAFSMGCPLSSDTYLTLFEKADASVRGAYAMINREFARRFCSGYRYINRAEDNGDEGLRQAKLSYDPDILQEVYMMKPKSQQEFNLKA